MKAHPIRVLVALTLEDAHEWLSEEGEDPKDWILVTEETPERAQLPRDLRPVDRVEVLVSSAAGKWAFQALNVLALLGWDDPNICQQVDQTF